MRVTENKDRFSATAKLLIVHPWSSVV